MKLGQKVAIGLLCTAGLAQAEQVLPPVVDGVRGGSSLAQGSLTSNKMTLEMYRQVEKLKHEVQQLRGELEELTYNMDAVKKRQRDIYLDLDRRLQPLEDSAGEVVKENVAPAKVSEIDGTKSIKNNSAGTHVIKQVSTNLAAEKRAYQKAFNTLKEGRYSESIKQFKAFLSSYPSGDYADNATYWLAETYYVTRDFDNAKAEFEKVIVSFPESQKVPDALLKAGYIAYELGEWKTARKKLTEVINRFPKSSAARLAENRLRRMKQEKH